MVCGWLGTWLSLSLGGESEPKRQIAASVIKSKFRYTFVERHKSCFYLEPLHRKRLFRVVRKNILMYFYGGKVVGNESYTAVTFNSDDNKIIIVVPIEVLHSFVYGPLKMFVFFACCVVELTARSLIIKIPIYIKIPHFLFFQAQLQVLPCCSLEP